MEEHLKKAIFDAIEKQSTVMICLHQGGMFIGTLPAEFKEDLELNRVVMKIKGQKKEVSFCAGEIASVQPVVPIEMEP